jgi:hypothetical protein
MNLRYCMDGARPREAQLALSYLVWPKECPDPRVVDEWLRRQGAGWVLGQDPIANVVSRRVPAETV